MGNYQKLLADEITLKTIKDEKIELQQRLEPTELGKRKTRLVQEEEEALYEEEVDDEELLDEVPADEILDEDEMADQLDQDLESAGEDDYDDEDASEYGVRGSRRKLKSKAKAETRHKSSGQRSKSKGRGAKRGPKRGKTPDNDDEDFEEGLGGEDGDDDDDETGHEKKKKDETVYIDNLPTTENEIRMTLKEVRKQIKLLEKAFFEEEDSEQEESLKQIANVTKHEEALAAFREHAHLKQFWCIPLSVNVMDFDFAQLASQQRKAAGRLFDVITIDPPWQLSSANPTRGVAIAYDTLNDKDIMNMPFDLIQEDGFLFIWVINAKYRFALDFFEKFNYK